MSRSPLASQQAPGKDGKTFGEQNERTGTRLKNSESEAIGTERSLARNLFAG